MMNSKKKLGKDSKKHRTSGGSRQPASVSGNGEKENRSPVSATNQLVVGERGGAMPEGARSKLWELFSQIEREFEVLHGENESLREKVDTLSEKVESLLLEKSCESALLESTSSLPHAKNVPIGEHPQSMHVQNTAKRPLRKIKSSGQTFTKKLKTYTPAVRKNRPSLSVECAQVRVYSGHRDGVLQVSTAKNGIPVFGSASADGSACVWDTNSDALVVRYTGHTGSVNSISFHPKEPIACTVSGDCLGHIWRYPTNALSLPLPPSSSSSSGFPRQRSGQSIHRVKHDSSGEERYLSDDVEDPMEPILMAAIEPPAAQPSLLRTPMNVLRGHKAPVMSCDWLPDGKQLVTASWDHTACLWDVESASVIHSMEGHDQDLTHVCAHPTQQLLVTSSLDTTFRLWDFRAPPIHSVNVFQGHSKAVNSATFSLRENVISGSDDHTVKIWDLRKMRAPIDSIRLDCGVNRISVSHSEHDLLAVPLDNRQLRLYDITGNRLANLPRRSREGHLRMVYCASWSSLSEGKPTHHLPADHCNLFSGGFDNKVIGWRVDINPTSSHGN